MVKRSVSTGTGPFIDTDNDTGTIVCVLIEPFF